MQPRSLEVTIFYLCFHIIFPKTKVSHYSDYLNTDSLLGSTLLEQKLLFIPEEKQNGNLRKSVLQVTIIDSEKELNRGKFAFDDKAVSDFFLAESILPLTVVTHSI